MQNAADVIDGLTASLTEKNDRVTLDGYEVEIIVSCMNNCGTDFESPLIISADSATRAQAVVVCGDCVAPVEKDDEDNESETLDKVTSHDAS